jgi:hypothetical protein
MPLYNFSSIKKDSNRADRLHPFTGYGFGAHCVDSFSCRDLKCLSAALGGASCEIGRS